MATATRKRHSVRVNRDKQESDSSQSQRNGQQEEVENSDRGDNQFRPPASRHGRREVDTSKGGRREGERANQGHKSEPEHDVPSERDETAEH